MYALRARGLVCVCVCVCASDRQRAYHVPMSALTSPHVLYPCAVDLVSRLEVLRCNSDCIDAIGETVMEWVSYLCLIIFQGFQGVNV